MNSVGGHIAAMELRTIYTTCLNTSHLKPIRERKYACASIDSHSLGCYPFYSQQNIHVSDVCNYDAVESRR